MKKSILDGHQYPSWKPFKLHLIERIEALRDSLEKSQTDSSSEKIRGRIAECRSMIAAVEPKQIKTNKDKPTTESIDEY